jgi:hypothetical protein
MNDPLAPLHEFHRAAVVLATHLIAQLDDQAQRQINVATQHGAVLSIELVGLPDAQRVQLWYIEAEGARVPVAKITTSAATMQ